MVFLVLVFVSKYGPQAFPIFVKKLQKVLQSVSFCSPRHGRERSKKDTAAAKAAAQDIVVEILDVEAADYVVQPYKLAKQVYDKVRVP